MVGSIAGDGFGPGHGAPGTAGNATLRKLTASLFAALSFLFCPLLLQKLTIAEPDTLITALSFACVRAVVGGETTGRVRSRAGSAAAFSWLRWPWPRNAAGGIFCLGCIRLFADRAAVARSAGLHPVHDDSGCGDHRVGRRRLSARRRRDMARVHPIARPPALLQLCRKKYSMSAVCFFWSCYPLR